MEEDIDGVNLMLPLCHTMVSVTLSSRFMKMDELERILSFTPLDAHLRFSGKANLTDGLFDGDRWEALIRTKLALLQRLEFDVTSVVYVGLLRAFIAKIDRYYGANQFHPREISVTALLDTSSLRNNVPQLSLKETALAVKIRGAQDRPFFPPSDATAVRLGLCALYWYSSIFR